MKMMMASAALAAAVIPQAAPIRFVFPAGDRFSAPGRSIPVCEITVERPTRGLPAA